MAPERLALVAALRIIGATWVQIADALADQFQVRRMAGLRLARGWSQRDAADAWNQRWSDELKTYKNFSYWESWPKSSGYAPSLAVLRRLAELYECAVADLLSGYGDFRHLDLAGLAERLPGGADQLVFGEQCPHGCTMLAYIASVP